MNDSLVCKRYELAQQVYAAHGGDTEQAMAAIDAIPISMHSWQGDDLLGFEGAEALTAFRLPAIIPAEPALQTSSAATSTSRFPAFPAP